MFANILRTLCTSKTSEVFDSLVNLGFTYNGRYAFRHGKTATSPMIVCHADTVVDGGDGPHPFSKRGNRVTSIALDDRLGIACMVSIIQHKYAMADCAFLVCDDEEIGRSTAKEFVEDVTPNWLVELDRRGTDVVCYDYDTPLLRSLLRSVGFDIGHGSFSDISSLEFLEVIGFNVGVGYHCEHTDKCHADLQDTLGQLDKLAKFYDRFGSIRLDHEPYVPKYRTSKFSKFQDFDDLDDRYDDLFDEDTFAWDQDAWKRLR
jgi:M42 glutamyl aminopeptidase